MPRQHEEPMQHKLSEHWPAGMLPVKRAAQQAARDGVVWLPIKSTKGGLCVRCTHPYTKGHYIMWHPGSSNVMHPACFRKSEAERARCGPVRHIQVEQVAPPAVAEPLQEETVPRKKKTDGRGMNQKGRKFKGAERTQAKMVVKAAIAKLHAIPGWNNTYIGQRMGVTNDAVRQWAKGLTVPTEPKLEKLKKLAAASHKARLRRGGKKVRQTQQATPARRAAAAPLPKVGEPCCPACNGTGRVESPELVVAALAAGKRELARIVAEL